MGTPMRSNSSRMRLDSNHVGGVAFDAIHEPAAETVHGEASRHFQRLTLGDIGVQVGGLGPQHAAACDACWLAVFAIR